MIRWHFVQINNFDEDLISLDSYGLGSVSLNTFMASNLAIAAYFLLLSWLPVPSLPKILEFMLPFLRQLLTYIGFYSRHPADLTQPSSSLAANTLPDVSGDASRDALANVSSVSCLPEDLPKNLPEDLQAEIRAARKFSLAEAIGREGGSFMKGESMIPRPLRATTAINQFIAAHLTDPASALSSTLQAWAKDDIRIARQLDKPLVALMQIIESILSDPATFGEFARQVAIAQSRLTGDRAIFSPEMTHEPIKADLTALLVRLKAQLASL